MFLSNLSIKRPVVATVMMLALVTLGLFSVRRLPIDLMPDVEIPVLSIITEYPGASPETVEREVSKKIEEAVNPIAGVKHVQSISREGLSSVVVEFNLEVKINDVSQEARAKINAVRRELPDGMKDPVIQKFDFNAMPVVSLAVRSNTMSPRDLTTLADRKIKRRLESIPGVAKAKLVGGSQREIAIDIDPGELAAYGMGVDEVVGGLASENVNTPLGRLTRGVTEMPLRISGKPKSAASYREMVISRRNGQPITVGDVATVVDGVEEQRSLALINGQPAVAIDITKQTKANTVQMVDDILATVNALQKELPPGTEIQVVRDTSTFIRESVADVRNTLLLGGFLTIVIVFLFLNSWRSTVITGLTLPISVISSFIVMYFLGMTLNTLTLMALSLAIGLLIDDAIVVRENIVRHLEKGQDHFDGRARRHRRDRPRGARDVDVDHRGVRAGRVHEGHHRPVLLPVRPHGRVRCARVAVRVVHARPDAVVALARPGHPPRGEAKLVAPSPGRVQHLVRADGGRLQEGHRLGARSPGRRVGCRHGRLRRRAGGVRPPPGRVHDADGPGRVRPQVQERARAPRCSRRGAAWRRSSARSASSRK